MQEGFGQKPPRAKESGVSSDGSPAKHTLREVSPWGVGWAGRPTLTRVFARNFLQIWRFVRAAWGIEPRLCSVCGFKGYFHAYGSPPRLDAACPRCSSLERHRQVALWLQRNPEAWRGKRVLHFAPDVGVRSILEQGAATFAGADLVPAPDCIQLNIEDIAMGDDLFDVVLCSHILEHVDDEAALHEMHRVTAPGGIVLIMVPLVYAWKMTYENPDVVTPKGRMLHFAQDDHLRYYGRDIAGRIANAGFVVQENIATEPDVLNYGLMRGDVLYICTLA